MEIVDKELHGRKQFLVEKKNYTIKGETNRCD